MSISDKFKNWEVPTPKPEGNNFGRTGISRSITIWTEELANKNSTLSTHSKKVEDPNRMKSILSSRAWEVATAPVKNTAMQIFMMWMMGVNGGIFSILIVVYALISALDQVLKIHTAFSGFKEVDCSVQKFVYLVLGLGVFGWIAKRAGDMGLLPIASADWISYL